MANKLYEESNVQAIADAIRAKTGESDTMTLAQMPGKIAEISGGGAQDLDEGVVFIDYDGTIVESWEPEAVAEKTALPGNPTHERLVAQGWNWTLAEIKDYVGSYPNAKITVGQMYKTESGKTEFDISLNKATGKSVTCKMVGTKDWGDGTINTDTSHTYADYGDYTILCDGTEITEGTSSSGGVFGTSVTEPNYTCVSIKVGEKVSIISERMFYNCDALGSVAIPNSVSSIGSNAFNNCSTLSVVIPNSVSSIGNYAFGYCSILGSVAIPNSVSSIDDHAFVYDYDLGSVVIPNSMSSIGNSAFYGCYALGSVVIPNSVSSLYRDAFAYCYSIVSYDFSRHTAIPELYDAMVFNKINGQCKILVPSALYDEWIAATNWATYANYIYPV